MAETITNITQPAPIFEEGAKKYLSELTGQTDVSRALDTSKFAPGVAQQNSLAQAMQQQAATQAGLGTLGFDPTTGAISGTTGATGIGGYQQFLDPASAQAGAAGTTLGNVRGQLTGAQTAAGLAQPLLTQAGQDIGTAAGTLGGVSPFISAAGAGLGTAGTSLGGAAGYLSNAAGLTGTGAGTGAGSIDSYMSPYQSQVRQATLDEYDTQAAAQRSAQTQQAGLGTVGNLDSGRFGVQLGAFDAQRQRDRALLDAQLGQQGFAQASQARQQDMASQLGLAGAQQQFAGAQAGLAGQQLGLGQATSGLAQQQAGIGGQRQQLAAAQQQLAGTGLGLGGAEQQLAQQQLGLGQYYGNLAQLQPQLAGSNLAIGQGLAGGDLQYRQAVEDAARQAEQMRQLEPLQRLDRFGQGLTGVMGGLGSVQTQEGPAAPVQSGLSSALNTGIGALSLGKLFGMK